MMKQLKSKKKIKEKEEQVLEYFEKKCEDSDVSEGNFIFSSWRKNDFTWTKEDYSKIGFQKVYCENQFSNRAQVAYEATRKALRDGEIEKKWKIASFGCGPGNDLYGAALAIWEMWGGPELELVLTGYYQNREYGIEMLGIDEVKEWEKVCEVVGVNTFINEKVDLDFLKKLQQDEYDMIIMSYAYYRGVFGSDDRLTKIEGFLDELDCVCKRLILIFDTTYFKQRDILRSKGYKWYEDKDPKGITIDVHYKINPVHTS